MGLYPDDFGTPHLLRNHAPMSRTCLVPMCWCPLTSHHWLANMLHCAHSGITRAESTYDPIPIQDPHPRCGLLPHCAREVTAGHAGSLACSCPACLHHGVLRALLPHLPQQVLVLAHLQTRLVLLQLWHHALLKGLPGSAHAPAGEQPGRACQDHVVAM